MLGCRENEVCEERRAWEIMTKLCATPACRPAVGKCEDLLRGSKVLG